MEMLLVMSGCCVFCAVGQAAVDDPTGVTCLSVKAKFRVVQPCIYNRYST